MVLAVKFDLALLTILPALFSSLSAALKGAIRHKLKEYYGENYHDDEDTVPTYVICLLLKGGRENANVKHPLLYSPNTSVTRPLTPGTPLRYRCGWSRVRA